MTETGLLDLVRAMRGLLDDFMVQTVSVTTSTHAGRVRVTVGPDALVTLENDSGEIVVVSPEATQ